MSVMAFHRPVRLLNQIVENLDAVVLVVDVDFVEQ